MVNKKQQFITNAQTIHQLKYGYDNVVFINSTTPVMIICPEHGEFSKSPNNHTSGKQGCPKCSKKHRPSTEEFISDMVGIHRNKYDYAKTVYGKNNSTKIIVSCVVHGDFKVTPANHRNGHGCPKCSNIKQGSYHKKDTDWFTQSAEQIHNSKYDYSKVKYERYHDKVEIVCSKHGSFFQTAGSHIHNKNGCPYCANENVEGGYGEVRFKNNPNIKNLPATLYLIQLSNDNEIFIKIGITRKSISERFSNGNKLPYDLSVINTKRGTLYEMFKEEQKIKKIFSHLKYRPKIKFNGHTECFSDTAKYSIKEELL